MKSDDVSNMVNNIIWSSYFRIYYLSYSISFFFFLFQTFAKLQNFTSSLRKNKSVENGKDENDNNDDNDNNRKTERVWKNAKVTAIDNLQLNEIKNSNLDTNTKEITKIDEFEAYNGQVLEEGSGDEDLGNDWHAGKLKFRKHVTDKLRIGGDGRKVDDYVVLDSRLKKKDNDEDNWLQL